MKRTRFLLGLIIISALFASCASHPTECYFGSYSEAEKLYQKGKYAPAAAKYETYLNENPQGSLVTVATYYLAKCYAAQGKTAAAKAGFQKVIANYPKTTWADFSRRQLKVLGS